MLFDLRGSGRRTTIKVVYLTLALLMGGGLVLFGIGGDVSGGLVDAITERGAGATSEDTFKERADEAQRRAQANPRDPDAWAALARARFQAASADRQGPQFTPEGQAQLRAADQAWERYLALDPKPPDDSIANFMTAAYGPGALNEPQKAVRAWEIIADARPSANAFGGLAIAAYEAGQTRKGDLARTEALELAEKPDRRALRAEIDQVRQAAASQQLQGALPEGATEGQAPPQGGGESGGGGGGDGGSGSGGGGGGGNAGSGSGGGGG